MGEQKITYQEAGNIRVIRGFVENDHGEDAFIIVRRLDGVIKINRNHVIKIETEGP